MKANKVGQSLGLFLAFCHLVWEVLIYVGAAKPLVDFILNMHSLNFSYRIETFNLGKGVALVLITYIVGYVGGIVFATIYNKVHKMKG